MVFSSILFLFYFLPLVLVIYYILPWKFKNAFLFLASLVFYAWGEPKYVFLMLAFIACNYIGGKRMAAAKNQHIKRGAFITTLIIDIGLLVLFKYTGFITDTVNKCLHSSIPALKLVLPVGISFYTFQALSYVIDVYKDKVKVQKSFISFGLYISLFPQLIAGPIVKYDDIEFQLSERKHDAKTLADGAYRFCVGLAKKVLIANNVGALWNEISADLSGLSTAGAWLGIIAFTLQIYFDFSGYSDMAIGLGKLFGFKFNENFNYPYIADSITDFWRRWHISLGTWFREYVYIPMGGNRVGKIRLYINIFVVWMLTGVWHGASWNFVMWGVYYGVLLVIEKTFLLKYLKKMPKTVRIFYTVFLVIIGWVFFSLTSMKDISVYLGAMFGSVNVPAVDEHFLFRISSYSLTLAIAFIASVPYPKMIFNRITSGRLYVLRPALAVVVMIICTAYLVDETYNPFLYFRF